MPTFQVSIRLSTCPYEKNKTIAPEALRPAFTLSLVKSQNTAKTMAENPRENKTARPPSPPISVRLLEMSERLAKVAKKNGWRTSDRFTAAHNTETKPIPKVVDWGGLGVRVCVGRRFDLGGYPARCGWAGPSAQVG